MLKKPLRKSDESVSDYVFVGLFITWDVLLIKKRSFLLMNSLITSKLPDER